MVGSGPRRLDEVFDQSSLDWENVIDEENVPFENFDSDGYDHFEDDTPPSPPPVRSPTVVRRLTVCYGGTQPEVSDCHNLAMRMLLVPVEDLVTSKSYLGGRIQGKEVLRYCRIGRSARDQVIAWLWLMLENTLFTDRSGTRIRVAILSEIIDDLTLVTSFRGALACPPERKMPHSPGPDNSAERLKKLRREIDGLTAADVTWLPYGLEPVDDDLRTLYNGGYSTEILLSHTCLHEYCARLCTSRPFLHLSLDPRSYKLDLGELQPSDIDETACVDCYLDWYIRVSHPLLVLDRATVGTLRAGVGNISHWINRLSMLSRITLGELGRWDPETVRKHQALFAQFTKDFHSSH
ncbi:OLC1v1025471C1 [Oldenlandia corymbosa var. corymbosa]|uniref:OLC1v1025471C1 n=1 Tax=Oldenlandia corymbosa var. corymbosa TaxID=529605 RepID=A0AAV1C7P1_OLDCO|nr:OLC1v1025471C1 [Oldenlandia corymbosa var. corymbosa]